MSFSLFVFGYVIFLLFYFIFYKQLHQFKPVEVGIEGLIVRRGALEFPKRAVDVEPEQRKV
jgi:hypothetical protein